jgi:hypothetical protein
MFDSHYRVAHELDASSFLPRVVGYLCGRVPETEIIVQLTKRIDSSRLDMDSASFLGHFTDFLAYHYPDGRFVVTIRDCFSWLRSIITHLATRRTVSRAWLEYQDVRFGRLGVAFRPEETLLEKAGLYPVAGFLSYWARMNAQLLDSTPKDRTLILKTEDLNRSVGVLAGFCGVSAATIRQAHENAMKRTWEGLVQLPAEFIRSLADVYCSDLMEQLYGCEWRGLFETCWGVV